MLSHVLLELHLAECFKLTITEYGCGVFAKNRELNENDTMNYDNAVAQLLNVDGALAAGVVDYDSGMLMAGSGLLSTIDLEIAAVSNTEVMRSKLKTMEMLGLKDEIEDILITLGKQYHLIRPLKNIKGLFLYSVLDKNKANLALSRRALLEVERAMDEDK